MMIKNKGFLSVPVSIIIAGALISLSIIFSLKFSATAFNGENDLAVSDVDNNDSISLENVRTIDAGDRILGNINAPVKIVEYSDPECPFCKRFHYTMKDVVKAYGDKVAWIYRHFPLDSLHSQAREESEAIECAGIVGGNVKFWSYLDRVMELTPSNDGLDLSQLPKIAAYIGLDVAKFEKCLSDGSVSDKIKADERNAMESGGQGTPFSIIIGPDNKKYQVDGAYPISEMKAMIDKIINAK